MTPLIQDSWHAIGQQKSGVVSIKSEAVRRWGLTVWLDLNGYFGLDEETHLAMWKKFYTNSGIIMLAVLAAGVWNSSGLSASPAGSALSQSVSASSQFGVPSEKEWQFHNLSGIPIWVVKNEVVGGNLTYQEIYILLESEYFKKEILTKLFAELSRKITVVNCVWIEAYSNKETLRQGIIIDWLSRKCLDLSIFTDDEMKALGLPIKSSVKKERTFYAYYSALPGKKFFYYTPVVGPETVEEVDIGEDND